MRQVVDSMEEMPRLYEVPLLLLFGHAACIRTKSFLFFAYIVIISAPAAVTLTGGGGRKKTN